MKTLLKRIDTTIDGVRYKTTPNANIICSSDGKMYRYTKQSSLVPFIKLTEICKCHKNTNGYGYLIGNYTDIDGNKIATSKHRIIAYTFGLIDDIHSPLDIDHINKITDDNRLDNLRAVTHKENLETRENGKKIKATVFGLHNDDGFELVFKSAVEAAQYLIKSKYAKTKDEASIRTYICNTLKKRNGFAYGFYWTYAD